ncbi:MAG: nucleotidyltransferase domain-containing protein [Clostridiales bacterium]|nr:nucleotidyltransferase domain-containing protein [Clostridiales bacterium]
MYNGCRRIFRDGQCYREKNEKRNKVIKKRGAFDMPMKEIEELKTLFVDSLLPLRIYLFGSYADNSYDLESDFDFYIVVRDEINDLASETVKAYKAVRSVKRHPVDILVGTRSRFEERKEIPSIENEVYRKGVLLYDAGN